MIGTRRIEVVERVLDLGDLEEATVAADAHGEVEHRITFVEDRGQGELLAGGARQGEVRPFSGARGAGLVGRHPGGDETGEYDHGRDEGGPWQDVSSGTGVGVAEERGPWSGSGTLLRERAESASTRTAVATRPTPTATSGTTSTVSMISVRRPASQTPSRLWVSVTSVAPVAAIASSPTPMAASIAATTRSSPVVSTVLGPMR
jgi:hypothetical protein